jgi:TatD DNase family protein
VRLVDSHCHIQADRFGGDVEAVLEAARAAGVERLLVPGWNAWSSEAALGLAARHRWIDASVGVHPHDASKVGQAEWETIVAQAGDPRVVAIGETGLDYDRVFSPIPDQLENLRRNLALARELRKPAILHVRSASGRRDAQDAMLEELGAARLEAFVIHSFSGPVDYARAILDLGGVISISGLAFRAGEESTAEVAALVPAERLLVETDSPFLSPPGGPRGRNEPEWVRITATWVADQRSVDGTDAAAVAAFGEGLVQTYDRTFGTGGRQA